jgi:hypothetical protein
MTGTNVWNLIVAAGLVLLPVSASMAEEFDWILTSVSNAGSIQNGDGHYWQFRSAGDGKWEVEGARGNVAAVTPAGENRINIDGFPSNWGANGDFTFSRTSGACVLESEHSRHKLEWSC